MVIDLGDTSAVTETSRPARVTDLRPVAFLAAVLAVLALGGSAAPGPPGLRTVLVTDLLTGAFALSPSALFTSSYVGGRAWVRRQSLTDRSVRWSAELPQSVGEIDLLEGSGLLMVTSPESAQRSILDSGTGAVLWRRTSGATTVLAVTGDSVLMTTAVAGRDTIEVERVLLRTGRSVWTRDLDATGYVAAVGPGRLVTVDATGRTAVLNQEDGAVEATADFSVAPDTGRYVGEGDTARFVSFGDRLYLARREGGVASLTAYRIPDLRKVWRSTANSLGWPTDCGDLLCVSTAAGMTALDAETGRERWSSRHWRLGSDSRSLRIPGPSRPVVEDAGHTLQRAVLDPATGRVRAALGHSQQVGPVVLRVDSRQIGRIWVQEIGAADRVRTLGSLDGLSLERCVAADHHLACADRTGRANVWRWRE